VIGDIAKAVVAEGEVNVETEETRGEQGITLVAILSETKMFSRSPLGSYRYLLNSSLALN